VGKQNNKVPYGESSFGGLFILGCAAYALLPIYIGAIFFLGIICVAVKLLSSLRLAVIGLLFPVFTISMLAKLRLAYFDCYAEVADS